MQSSRAPGDMYYLVLIVCVAVAIHCTWTASQGNGCISSTLNLRRMYNEYKLPMVETKRLEASHGLGEIHTCVFPHEQEQYLYGQKNYKYSRAVLLGNQHRLAASPLI